MNISLGNETIYVNNNSDTTQLPYILTALGDKLLIDTGSARTLINPEFVQHYYPEQIFEDPFCVATSHGITYHNCKHMYP